MEKTNSAKTDSKPDETTQSTAKWMTDSCSAMMNIYNEQLKATLGFYNNLLASFSGADREGNIDKNVMSPFLGGFDLFRSMMVPFSSFKANSSLIDLLTAQFEEGYKQIHEFNTKLIYAFQHDSMNRRNNWNELREKYNKAIDEEWKTLQNATNSIVEAYFNQLNNTREFNKKLVKEIAAQFETAAGKNKEFLSDLIKTSTIENETEKEYEHRNGHSKKNNKVELAHH